MTVSTVVPPADSAPSAAPSVPACLVRPPWPDELPRLADAFPRGNFNRPIHPLVLVAPGSPERIVGFTAIIQPVEGQAGLTCAFRPRFIDSTEADRLLSAAVRLAGALGAHELRTADDIPPDSLLASALRRAGFARSATREIWEVSVAALATRLERLRERVIRGESALSLGEFTPEPLGAANLEGVKTLLAETGRLTPDRNHDLNTEQFTRAYDLGLSLAVRHRGRIVTVALLKSHGKLVTFETLAVSPDFHLGLKPPLPLLLAWRGVAQACLAADLPALFFSAEREPDSSALRLASRSGGRQAGAAEIFTRLLSATSP